MSKKLNGLKYMLLDELEQFADKGSISGGDLDPIYKLSGAAKRIACICEMEEGGSSGRYYASGYDEMPYNGGSYRGDRSYRSSYDGSRGYNGGRSGEHYVRGHYSRNGSMREHLESMMRDARDDREREKIQRMMDEMA